MIDGVEVAVDREAVVVTAREPMTVVSSAFVRGGFTEARAIVNLHVRKNIPEAETDGMLPRFVERREIQGPWVGLLTSAWTEKAVVAEAAASGLTALAVVTVGLSNRIAAGQTPLGVWAPSTINAIVVVDGAAESAALVNAVMTVTEAKSQALWEAGFAGTGTPSDAVAVLCAPSGPAEAFGGPRSRYGSRLARAVHRAVLDGSRRAGAR